MSQCRPRKSGFALSYSIVLAAALSACSVADLERFATEATPTKTGAATGVPLGYTADAYLVPDHIINGGKHDIRGKFARLKSRVDLAAPAEGEVVGDDGVLHDFFQRQFFFRQ